VRTTGGTLTQNLGLPGQWFQLESGLAHNWHRHYDSTTGRYTTADPLGFVDGPSVFAYAGNAPHVMVDPTGLQGLAGPAGNFTPRPRGVEAENCTVQTCAGAFGACQKIRDRATCLKLYLRCTRSGADATIFGPRLIGAPE
jgi:RHS repeat-associated protein